MDRDKLLDRIRRLLRLAESPNVNEAAVAAARAQELMARHRIEAAALEEGEPGDVQDLRDAPLDESKRLRAWKTHLADGIARANGCRVYVLERDGTRRIVIVGRADDAELVRLLYGELVKRVECLTRHHGQGQTRRFCNAFRLGVVMTLRERLALSAAEAKHRALEGECDAEAGDTALAPASTALALARLEARDDAVERFMEANLRLRPGRKKGLRAEAEGYERGRIAGHGVDLGVSSSERRGG